MSFRLCGVLWLLWIPLCSRAEAQFVSYSAPGSFQGPSGSREAVFDREMQEAKWRFGRLLVDPWIGLRNVGYQDHLTQVDGVITPQPGDVSDLTVTLGAGINTYMAIGSDFIWGTFVLPEYVWWQDLSERSRLNHRYGTGLSGNLGMVYKQYVPPAMEPGVVVSMAKLIPQPQQVFVRGQGPFNGLGYMRFQQVGPFHEPAVVRRMSQDLDTPMMAGAFGAEAEKPTLRDAAIGIAIGGVVLIGDNATVLIPPYADRIETKSVGVGPPSNGEQNHIGLQRFGFAAICRLDGNRNAAGFFLHGCDFGRKFEAKALLGEKTLKLFGDFGIEAGTDAIEKLDDLDFCAKSAPNRTQFQPDHACANHQKPLGHRRQRQPAGRRNHRFLIDFDAL